MLHKLRNITLSTSMEQSLKRRGCVCLWNAEVERGAMAGWRRR